MDDYEAMYKCRLKWVREMAAAGRPMPTEMALAAYHRAFFDALNLALGRVIGEERTDMNNYRSSTTGE